jgi:hypothetical protein
MSYSKRAWEKKQGGDVTVVRSFIDALSAGKDEAPARGRGFGEAGVPATSADALKIESSNGGSNLMEHETEFAPEDCQVCGAPTDDGDGRPCGEHDTREAE